MASFFKHGAPRRTGRRAGPLATTVLLAGLALAGAPSRAAEPKVPPAPAPDGVAVAILGPGVDYRAPSLVRRLARDGEGDLISWDFADADNRPFEAPPADAGTRFAQDLAAAAAGATLVIVRERPGDPQAFGHMMSFVAKTPARIVVWPSAAPDRPDWAILLEAAGQTDRFCTACFTGDYPVAFDNQLQKEIFDVGSETRELPDPPLSSRRS